MSTWWASPYNNSSLKCYYNLASFTEIIFNEDKYDNYSIQFWKGNELSTELQYSVGESHKFYREYVSLIKC